MEPSTDFTDHTHIPTTVGIFGVASIHHTQDIGWFLFKNMNLRFRSAISPYQSYLAAVGLG